MLNKKWDWEAIKQTFIIKLFKLGSDVCDTNDLFLARLLVTIFYFIYLNIFSIVCPKST